MVIMRGRGLKVKKGVVAERYSFWRFDLCRKVTQPSLYLYSEMDPTIADLLSEIKSQKEEIKEFVNAKVSSLRDEIKGASASAASDLRKLKGQSEIEWKSKGHKKQYSFNLDIQEDLESIKWAISNGKADYALEVIGEADKKIKERNKHIRIADSSVGGWETVNQYVSNPVASDSEDENKIYKAESRAVKKRKTLVRAGNGKEQKFKQPKAGTSQVADYGTYTPVFGNAPRVTMQQKQQSGIIPFRFGGCYVCEDFTHFQRECPLNKSRPSSGTGTGMQPERK